MKVPKEVSDKIIEKAPLDEYINKFYPEIDLRLIGSWYKGYCPFHKDDKPSFAHRKGSKIYKCFGCGETGNIFTLVKKMEDVNYEEACKIVGDNIGVEVKIEPPNPYFEKYKDTFTSFAERYHRNLLDSEEALNYLINKRKLTMDTINEFNLGLTYPDEYKHRGDYPQGGIKDRITFPIYEHKRNPKVVAFGYGTYHGEDPSVVPKYINDCNQEGKEAEYRDGKLIKAAQDKKLTGVFVKGDYLYGAHIAEAAAKNPNCNNAIIVEGYFDVLSMHQSKIRNTFGLMGTEFSEKHMDYLLNVTPNLTFFLDGDSAGRDKMFNKLETLYKRGFNIMVVLSDSGKDPDIICRKHNHDYYKIMGYIHNIQRPGVLAVMEKYLIPFDNYITKKRMDIINAVKKYLEILPEPSRQVYVDILYRRLFMK